MLVNLFCIKRGVAGSKWNFQPKYVNLHLIELPICNSTKRQNEVYRSRVTIQYHPNVTNRFTESSQTIFFLHLEFLLKT